MTVVIIAGRRPFVKASHGKAGTPEHRTWLAMHQRCLDPKAGNYHRYGGRGIAICERWLHSFENFLADVGPKPSAKHSIDRIDGDGDYTPENTRWADKATQSRNRANVVMLTHDGLTMTRKEWSAHTGIPYTTICWRVGKGFPIERVLAR